MTVFFAMLVSCFATGQAPLRNDWPMFGGSPSRNLVNLAAKNVPTKWDVESKQNIKWSAKLGFVAHGGPVVANGRIFVGTTNWHARQDDEKGILLCLREEDGSLMWEAGHESLPRRVNEWPGTGVTSTPCVDGDRVYYMSNRCELVCLDVRGFADGNQGVKDEELRGPRDADVIWKLDFMKTLRVFPHNASASSPLVIGDLVYVVTGNGMDETHFNVPFPRAPSFVAVDKNTGHVVWKDASPGKNIRHGQWSSPSFATIKGVPQVIFPGGDGWLRGFEPKTGKLLWKFDCNPKQVINAVGGRGTRNDPIAPAVVHDEKLYVTVGDDPEHGEGVGHLWCIDPSKATPTNIDLSPVDDNFDPKAEINRHSGLVWHLGGQRPGADPADRVFLFRRSLSSCAVHDGLCFTADLSGFVHCVDAATGKRYWEHDAKASIWASPMWIDGKVYLGTEDGNLMVFEASRSCKLLADIEMGETIYNPVVAANGTLYVQTRSKLFAIR